jgi:hypothetical protein
MSFWDGPLQITIELRDAAGVDWQTNDGSHMFRLPANMTTGEPSFLATRGVSFVCVESVRVIAAKQDSPADN